MIFGDRTPVKTVISGLDATMSRDDISGGVFTVRVRRCPCFGVAPPQGERRVASVAFWGGGVQPKGLKTPGSRWMCRPGLTPCHHARYESNDGPQSGNLETETHPAVASEQHECYSRALPGGPVFGTRDVPPTTMSARHTPIRIAVNAAIQSLTGAARIPKIWGRTTNPA